MRIHPFSSRAFRVRLAVLVVAPVLALTAACGGEGGGTKGAGVASVPDIPSADGDEGKAADSPGQKPPAGGKGDFYDAQMKYVQCMRTKAGIPEFPDPKLSGHLDWAKIDEIAAKPGNEEAPKGGKNGACTAKLSEAMKLEPKRDGQKDYESMMAHAKCMREKGISKFNNPTLSGGNVTPGGVGPMDTSVDHDSATYKQARAACKDKLLVGLDGMQ
ncbi:hypothetical protein [Streptomyces sp. x-80]|uniref:hypothetical protein n=1 Tax=Streptomyces sp. x-80 TaxID=2789282 RepID=UPI00397EF874